MLLMVADGPPFAKKIKRGTCQTAPLNGLSCQSCHRLMILMQPLQKSTIVLIKVVLLVKNLQKSMTDCMAPIWEICPLIFLILLWVSHGLKIKHMTDLSLARNQLLTKVYGVKICQSVIGPT